MAKTLVDLRRGVLVKLTVIDATENPDAEQTATLDPITDGCRAALLELGLCWWDADAIPDSAYLAFRNYVVAEACADFGRAGKGFEALKPVAERELKRLKPSEEREVTRHEFF